MKRVMAGLAAGAVWLLAAMPVLAQQPTTTIDDLTEDQKSELYCVYDYLSFFGDPEGLTTAYMSGDVDGASYQQQLGDVEEVTAECADEYTWDEDRTDAAATIGLYGVMGDEIEARLTKAGLNEASITAIYDVVDALSDDDIDTFIDGAWSTDKALLQRLGSALQAKGITGEAVLTNCYFLAEAYILVSLLTHDWLITLPAKS